MTRDDTLEVIKALSEEEARRPSHGNLVAWTAIVLAAGATAAMVWIGNNQLAVVEEEKAAIEARLTETEARLGNTIKERDTRIEELVNIVNQKTDSLSSREQAIRELELIILEVKGTARIVEAGRLLLTLADQNSVTFRRSQSTLSSDQREKLAENLVLLRYAKTFPEFGVQITGHTDNTWDGQANLSDFSKDQNQKLSIKRAEAVKQFLVEHEIPSDKIRVEGRGMLWPRGVTSAADDATITARNQDEPARRDNRRVEVLIEGVDFNAPSARRTADTGQR